MKYWIGVVAADHAKVAVREGVCAFSHGKRGPVEKLGVGDRFVYYSPKTGINEGDTVQAFTAIGEVTGETAFEKQWAGTDFTAWVREARFTPIDPIPVKPMLEDLSFVTNPRYWGMAFRRGQFEISEDDYLRIAAQA